jgi:hypothetical protein
MNPGDTLVSPGGNYTVTMQVGGNLVLGTSTQTQGPWIWESGTSGNNDATCKMTLGGDLFIYDANHNRIKHSGTGGNNGAMFVVQDSGSVTIVTSNGQPLDHPWVNGPMTSVGLTNAAA